MATLLLGSGVFLVAVLGLALGVLLGREPPRRGCTMPLPGLDAEDCLCARARDEAGRRPRSCS